MASCRTDLFGQERRTLGCHSKESPGKRRNPIPWIAPRKQTIVQQRLGHILPTGSESRTACVAKNEIADVVSRTTLEALSVVARSDRPGPRRPLHQFGTGPIRPTLELRRRPLAKY